MKIHLGTVGHFSLAVEDPDASAAWWKKLFDVKEIFRFDDVVGLTSSDVTIAFHRGKPHPKVIGHMSFHLPDMAALRDALDILKKHDVSVEDPGDEIGPEAPGSKNVGLWFHDPDGYRWELNVQGGVKE